MWVPAGRFLMGSSNEDTGVSSDEKPQHLVSLYGYWIYKTAVTVAQYHHFCQATGRQMPESPSWGWLDTHPMVNICWNDAHAYAKWAGVVLPTEAEWERAARGTDGRSYPWGNDWDAAKCSNSVGNTQTNTSPVGSFPAGASPSGCLDMAGNVWQWCADWYGAHYYQHAPATNPIGEETDTVRVMRGGSWNDCKADFFRVAYRDWCEPTYCDHLIGFRCVARPPGAK